MLRRGGYAGAGIVDCHGSDGKASCTDERRRRDHSSPLDSAKRTEAAKPFFFISLPSIFDITAELILHPRAIRLSPQLPNTNAERPRTEKAQPVPTKYCCTRQRRLDHMVSDELTRRLLR